MEEDKNQIGVVAEVKPAAETKQDVTPIPIEELQAKVKDLEAKYQESQRRAEERSRQLGERDKGLARLTAEKERLKQAVAELARSQYGVTEPASQPYEEFRKKYIDAEETPTGPTQGPALTTEQQDATDELMEILAGAGLNPYKPPEELNPQVQLAGYYLGRGQFEKARVLMDKAVKSYQTDKKAEEIKKAEMVKTKADVTKKVAEEGRTARIGSPGTGPGEDFESVRAAYIKDPRDPVIKARYSEMRAQRGRG